MAIQRDKVIASAEKLVAKGKIEPAIKEYERLLEDNPNDVNTLNRIGDLWVRINRNDEAVKVFGKIADHYSKDGFFLKAIAIYKKINKLDPSKLDIYAKLADLYAKQGLAMEAKSQYQVLADYYLKHGDPGNALAIYRKISELDPNSINVHVKLADLYSQNNQTGEALKEYDRVGKMLLKRGMLDEAVQVFRKAMKIDSGNLDLAESLVTALLEARDFDTAVQIIEAALEINRENPRLLALLGRVYLSKGDGANARTTLERGLSSNPTDPAIREALADLYLRQGTSERAVEMLTPTIDAAVARGDTRSALDMLNRVLRADAGNVKALEKVVAVYTRLNEESNILASMNSLAEAHISRGNFEGAAGVVEKLIQREPQNAQHRNKLAFVHSQMGGVDTLPARPRTSAGNIPVVEPPSSLTSVGSFEDLDTSMSLDLDASEPLDLDFGNQTVDATPPPPMFVPEPESPESDMDDAGEDLDFITEHLTEAEVFAKYGLAEKAAEHLRAIIERSPRNQASHEKLYKLLLDEGEIDQARAIALAYVALLDEAGNGNEADAVSSEFTSRGHALRPAKRAATVERAMPRSAPTMERPMPAAKPTVAEEALSATALGADDEMEFDLDGETETNFDLDATLEPASASFSLDSPAIPALDEEPAFSLDSLGDDSLTTEDPAMTFDEPVDQEFETLLASPEHASTLESFIPDEDMFGDMPAAPLATSGEDSAAALSSFDDLTDDPFFGVEPAPPGAAGPAIEEIGEVDFYVEQELFDEAQRKINQLLAQYPGNAELEERLDRINQARAQQPAMPVAAPESAPAPLILSRDEIETELMSAIPDDDDDFLAPPPPARPAPPPPIAKATAQEENLFADEDDFFDLAAELEEELAEDEAESISLSEEEQSLEEIFKEFKKGVEQQLDSEDYDTHYNLGIAYKEMGLIDEAIGEFQLASKDPKRAVECASMLGLCFLEKGMPQLAIKWYRKGLEMPEITEDEHIGMLYDLGSAHLEVGDTSNAQKAFMEVYGMNSNYRDIVSRIKQVEDVRQ